MTKHLGCKGQCKKIYKPNSYITGCFGAMFKQGRKYCSKCEFTLFTLTHRCLCCGKLFRWRPISPNKNWKPINERRKQELTPKVIEGEVILA